MKKGLIIALAVAFVVSLTAGMASALTLINVEVYNIGGYTDYWEHLHVDAIPGVTDDVFEDESFTNLGTVEFHKTVQSFDRTIIVDKTFSGEGITDYFENTMLEHELWLGENISNVGTLDFTKSKVIAAPLGGMNIGIVEFKELNATGLTEKSVWAEIELSYWGYNDTGMIDAYTYTETPSIVPEDMAQGLYEIVEIEGGFYMYVATNEDLYEIENFTMGLWW